MAKHSTGMPHAVGGTAILLFLLLNMADTEETAFALKPEGGLVEFGHCFAADYMVVFRSSPTDRDQLQVNTSADNAATSWGPPDLWGRAKITNRYRLLGLLILHLTPQDSGLYRIECWQNGTLASHRRQQLVICGEEVPSEEMTVLEDGGADVRCGGGGSGGGGARPGAGATVRWYYETHLSNKAVLFLDSSVSLEPLLPGLRGTVDVRDGGTWLRVSESVLKDSQRFYCAVMEGQNCLRFQNVNKPESADVRAIYASQGDRVALKCSSAHKRQSWDTPLGRINTTAESPASREGGAQPGQMFISGDNTSIGRSLVVPVVSDKHEGSYSCFSPTLVVQYFLVLCPGAEPREKSAAEGGDVLLECDARHKVSVGDANRVQWRRDRAAGEERLTPDTEADRAAPRPREPGWGVTEVSEDGSSLKLTGLTADDTGLYWCVVLAGPDPLQRQNNGHFSDYDDPDFYDDPDHYDDPDYDDPDHYDDPDDYDDPDLYDDPDHYDDYDSYDDGNDLGWLTNQRCIAKQEILLTVGLNSGDDKGRGLDLPAPRSGVPASAVGAAVAVAGVLLVGVIIAAVVVMKKRSKGCFKQGGAVTDAGLQSHRDADMAADPSCTEMLSAQEAC